MTEEIRARIEYLRGEIEAERISMSELIELQELAEHIEPQDVLLLEWAGVPEDRCEHDRFELRQTETWGYDATMRDDGTVVVDYGAGGWSSDPTDPRVVCKDCSVNLPYEFESESWADVPFVGAT